MEYEVTVRFFADHKTHARIICDGIAEAMDTDLVDGIVVGEPIEVNSEPSKNVIP